MVCFIYAFVRARSHSTKYHTPIPRYTTLGLYVLRCRITLNTPSSAQLIIAQKRAAQRRAVLCCAALPCPAVRCRAVLCRAVPCYAVLSLEHSTRYHAKYLVPDTGMYVRVLVFFAFFLDCPPSRSASRFFLRKLHPYCRSERDIANKNTAQHRQDHQLCTSSSWHYQLLVAPNRGPLLSAPFTFS